MINILNEYLEKLVKEIEVPESLYTKATNRFNSLIDHLKRDDSILRSYEIKLYPQGSFNIGTAIRPCNRNGEYDVDVVCEINADKHKITQNELKQLVGYEVEKYRVAHNFQKPLEEGSRCWTLQYSETEQFHMDILPAIPEVELNNYDHNNTKLFYSNTAICITDKNHPGYYSKTKHWNVSNPSGYAEWFIRKMYGGAYASSVASRLKTPVYSVRSNLQKVVQILKWHRDMMFQNDDENKPISIIITTLAAEYYNPNDTLLEALVNISSGMYELISRNPNNLVILNPVNKSENFADKWREYPAKEEAFREWAERIAKQGGASEL